MEDLYTPEAQARRDRFNNIINKIDAVLINKIPEVDPSVWDNWETDSPAGNDECEIEENEKGIKVCLTHDSDKIDEYDQCDGYEPEEEVYQWFAISQSDAEYLKERNQYITYSDTLDAYFWAITHFGTSWDYVDSMVSDILQENE